MLDAEAIAASCARLALFEKVALERVLARGGRARLDEVGLDPAVIARLERVVGWFGFEKGSPKAGAGARVAIAEEARDLVASSLAGVPSLRNRPIVRLGAASSGGLDAASARARARAQGSEALIVELAARGGVALLAALPRELRQAALEKGALAGLGDVGRLDLREKGVALDGPVAVLTPETLAALACEMAPRLSVQGGLAGALLAVEPALALARESELEETKQGGLASRSRERLGKAYPRAKLELTPEKDELDQLVGALVEGKILERQAGGLIPGRGAAPWRALAVREQALHLLRAYGARSVLAELAAQELLGLDRPAPADLPVRLAALRLVDAPPPRPAVPPVALEDALAQAFTELLPAAEALGLVAYERVGATAWIRPTPLLASLASAAGAHPLVIAADGEALVVPGPGAAEAALLLGRIGELVSSGELLRYAVTPASAAAAQASGDDLEATLARVRALVRGEVPAGFERLLREAAASSVRARVRVLHVLEVPRVLAADRAARVLGSLVLDRITPTLLALTGPLTPAARRVLAREGVFIDEP